jgi:nucleoside-diphosphate-sugar epimerase
VDVVVHLAARAHVLQEGVADPLAEFRRVNVDGALSLARQSIANGVKRFIFISSIGVNGGFTSGQAFTENSPEAPHADYAQSKQEAERALKTLAEGSGMELVVIRPPLVYAANAPGNFRRLLKLVASGLPMPFGSVNNRRTMVALPNLVDFINACIQHPAAANETFLVSDSQSISTGEMARLLSQGMGKTTMLLPVPDALMKWTAKLAGKSNLYVQLCCSLEVDNAKARRLLNWQPPLTAQAALVQVGSQYKTQPR